ncbi:hypothetical protein FH972_026240 [Carpinus fangiana]|uniref:Nephrocystin 3-like N-terminal domain-containing protein n=1 Tax=Carpinus fangiana TaxID=176857 RepID=A0A5N6L603_9ROSI|nr:hypothetical protein FH972_026240 [Carpinus fangiana]
MSNNRKPVQTTHVATTELSGFDNDASSGSENDENFEDAELVSQTTKSSSETNTLSSSTTEIHKHRVSHLPMDTRPASRPDESLKSRMSLFYLGGDQTQDPSLKLLKPTCSLPPAELVDRHGWKTDLTMKKTLNGSDTSFGQIVQSTEFMSLFEFIADQRLRTMPHQGSTWDKVLRWAASFARNVNDCAVLLAGDVEGVTTSTRWIYGSIHTLLKIGPQNAGALENVFTIFQQMGHVLGFFCHQKQHLGESEELFAAVLESFSDLLELSAGIVLHFIAASSNKRIDASIIRRIEQYLDPYVVAFYSRKDRLILQIWERSLNGYADFVRTRVTIQKLKSWLQGVQVERGFRISRMTTRSARHEFSNEWFYDIIKSFNKGSESILSISGATGSGKSTLIGYVVEQLECPRGGPSDRDIFFYSFTGHTDSSFSFAKKFVFKLLDILPGKRSLYSGVLAAWNLRESQATEKDIELALWRVIESALSSQSRDLAIVVDGIDQFETPDGQVSLHKRLIVLARKYAGVKLIIAGHAGGDFTSGTRHICLEEHNKNDIRRFFDYYVLHSDAFAHFSEEHRKAISHHCKTVVLETYLQAELYLHVLQYQKTIEAVKAIIVKITGGLEQQLEVCCSTVDFDDDRTRLILSVLLVSRSTMTVNELTHFLLINAHNCQLRDENLDIESAIRKQFGGLVVVRGGNVSFSHPHVKKYLLNWCSQGKTSFTIQQAHRNLTLRSLAYMSWCFGKTSDEPSFDCRLDTTGAKEFELSLQQKYLLEYSVQNWIIHFKGSGWYKSEGGFDCPPALKACFPKTVRLAILEGSWWNSHHSAEESEQMYNLALELRLSILGQTHKGYLQSKINLGRSHARSNHHHKHSVSVFYEIWRLCKEICGKESALCVEIGEYYTETVMKLDISLRIEYYSQCEEIYQFLWIHYKQACGEDDETTLKYAEALAEIYLQLEKYEKSEDIFRRIRAICIKKVGHFYQRTIRVTKTLIRVLTIVGKTKECDHICEDIVRASEEELECWHVDRITTLIRFVEVCEHNKDFEKAERLLVQLRLKLIEACKSHHEEHVHEARIEITMQLIWFLKRQKRDEEAKKLLIELWTLYEKPIHGKDKHNHAMLLKLKIIAEEMKVFSNVTIAKKIFSTLIGWFRSSGHKEDAIDVSILLGHCHHHLHDKDSEEKILKETWEITIETEVIERRTITTTHELCGFYEREGRYKEAHSICRRLLLRIWDDFFSGSSRGCRVPKDYRDEAIRFALQLARLHVHVKSVHEAIKLYVTVFTACKRSLTLTDKHVIEVAEILVGFYEEHGMIDEAIEFCGGFRDDLIVELGHKHELTIKINYRLAHLCRTHGRSNGEKYLLDIALAFGFGETACHHASMEAVLLLRAIYQSQRNIKQLRKCYYSLWLTFRDHGHSHGIDLTLVYDIFTNYLLILKSECSQEEVIEWVIEFRKVCIERFDAKHRVCVMVSLEMAALMERHEHHHELIISIYEELIRWTEQKLIVLETILDIRGRLAHIYCSHERYYGKAELIVYESWMHCVHVHGHGHEQSLAFLVEYIEILKKRNGKDWVNMATTHLRTTILAVFKTSMEITQLVSCARVVGGLYLQLQLQHELMKLIKQIRAQLIQGKRSSHEHWGCLIHGSSQIKLSLLVFVLTLENTCNGGHAQTYEDLVVIAELEKSLWESWLQVRHSGVSITVKLAAGVRLFQFLCQYERQEESSEILDVMWSLFTVELGMKATLPKSATIWELFQIYVSSGFVKGGSLGSIISVAAAAVVSLYESRSFKLSLEIATWLHGHICSTKSNYTSKEYMDFGFGIALCLSGRLHRNIVCIDRTLDLKMKQYAMVIFDAIMQVRMKSQTHLHTLAISELNLIISILGEQKKFAQLETILAHLWFSRHDTTWDSRTSVAIGYRLCEVRFAAGQIDEAIELAEDIVYNLRRVFGPFDEVTLAFANLLSSFYSSQQRFEDAYEVHVGFLQLSLEDEDSCDAGRRAGVALEQMHMLRLARQRAEKLQEREQEDLYRRLVGECADRFESHEGAWLVLKKEVEVVEEEGLPVTTGKVCGQPALAEKARRFETKGCWHAPIEWRVDAVTFERESVGKRLTA